MRFGMMTDREGVFTRTAVGWCLLLALCLVLGYILWPRLPMTELERQALAEGRTIITYWDRHFGHEHESRKALIAEFNQSQNEVYVRTVPIGYNALMEKILTSTAGAAPPDVCSLDGGMLAQLAPHGLFLPLDDLFAETPSLNKDEFLPHIWQMVFFDGHVWAVPTTTDAYCLIWNKAAFRRAGLDPERPPQTIAELEDYAARLTLRNEAGMIEQMGFLPWLPWDQSTMWGILFGGEWYNEATGRVEIASDPAIIASFAWQQSFAIDPSGRTPSAPYAMDPRRIAAFTKGLGDYMSANNPFYAGKVAMISEGEWQVTFIPKYAPGLEWGVAPIPQPEGAPLRAFGQVCVTDVIPATSRNPDAAKAFLRWFYSPRQDGRPSPASDYNHAIHNIPPRREEAMQDRFDEHPKFRVFVEELLYKPAVPMPTTPVMQFYSDQLERHREQVTAWLMTPEEAVQSIEDIMNRELERNRAIIERRRR